MITIGADPEFFILNENNMCVASQGILPGDKQEPYLLEHGASVHRDNVLGEIGIAPATTEDEFVKNINLAVDQVKQMLARTKTTLAWFPSFFMDYSQLQHYEAAEFGCLPDYDCWGLEHPQQIDPIQAGTLRSAGGHVHLGFDLTDKNPEDVAKACDITLGLGSVLLDTDKNRRLLYGKAGRYRPKPYGVEYRTLSNFWLKNERCIRWVFRGAKEAAINTEKYTNLSEEEVLIIKSIINQSDAASAYEYLEKYEVEIPA